MITKYYSSQVPFVNTFQTKCANFSDIIILFYVILCTPTPGFYFLRKFLFWYRFIFHFMLY